MQTSENVFIFAGRATENLARRVAEIYGIPLGNSTVFQYADGEFQPSFEETIRGGIVFLIQSTTPPTDNLFELLMMIDAAKRASASKIVAVIPYYGFARQDRKDKPHVPIASRLVADMLTAAVLAGATSISAEQKCKRVPSGVPTERMPCGRPLFCVSFNFPLSPRNS